MAVTMVRNLQPGPLVFADESTGHKPLVWQGYGEPGDTKSVPQALLESVGLQDNLSKGVCEIVEDAAEARRIQAEQRQSFQAAQYDRSHASVDKLDRKTDNDTLSMSCIGPAGRGTDKLCGKSVLVKSAKRDEQPPLCDSHKYLRTKFVSEETDEMVNGKAKVVWRRVSVG